MNKSGRTCLLAAVALVAASATGEVIRVADKLQVLWDDYVVDVEKTTASRVVHQPEYVGVAITHDKPWEGDGCNYHNLLLDRDEKGDVVRMYYLGWAMGSGWKDVRKNFLADGIRVCYAESRDGGLTWNKPSLGLVSIKGSTDNNCILDKKAYGCAWDNFLVFKDENPDCLPEERYKGIGSYKGELWCFPSSDGIHFALGRLVMGKGAFDSLNIVFWDKARGEYHMYFRAFHNGVRDVRHSVSKDFKTWTQPKLIDFGEGAEEVPLYTNMITPYFREPSLYVGFPSRYVERKAWTPNFDRLPSPEKRRWRMKKGHPRYGLTVTDCIFIFSRDGQRFFRADEAFMRPGPECPANWVYGDCYPAYRILRTPSPVGADDELSFFAFDRHWSGLASRLCRYRLRQDGFISRRAKYAGQKVVTKPIDFTGSQMLVNFSTSALGRMFVTIRDETGASIKSEELFGDKVDRPVDFAADGRLADFAGKPVVVEFDMYDADLYSFRFSK